MMPRQSSTRTQAPYKKKGIPSAVRRDIARKYGCPPGGTISAPCHYCGKLAEICWWPKSDGTPGSWVTFGHEMDHVRPEFLNGPSIAANIVLACRRCNRSKGARA